MSSFRVSNEINFTGTGTLSGVSLLFYFPPSLYPHSPSLLTEFYPKVQDLVKRDTPSGHKNKRKKVIT